MTAGVYAIFNMNNGLAYVGSSVNIERRWYGRVWEFSRGMASNKRLQDDWLATQGQGFEFRILEVTTADNTVLLRAEEQWISCLGALSPGLYNVRKASVGRHGLPIKHRGWAWVSQWNGHKTVRSKKAHYFMGRSRLSLCSQERKARAYSFEDDNHDSPSNCVACRKAHALLPKMRRHSYAPGGREAEVSDG